MSQATRNEEEGLWTAEKVASYLGLHTQTVYRKARLGELPSIKVRHLLRFRPEEIREWVEGNSERVEAADDAGGEAA